MSGLHRDINAPRNFLPSRRLQKPRDRSGGETGPGLGRRPGDLGARPLLEPDQDSLRSGCSTDLLDQGKHSTTSPIDPKMHRRGGLYKETPLAPGEDMKKLS